MQKRGILIFLGVSLAMIGLLVAGAAWWLGLPQRTGPRTVTDQAERISLAIPAGWTDETPRDARRIVPGDSGDGAERVPDIVVYRWSSDEDDFGSLAVIRIYLEVAPEGVSLKSLHEVSQWISGEGFREDAAASVSPVQHWRSLASTSSRYDGDASEIVTVLSDNFVVTAYVIADDESNLKEADRVIATLEINDVW